MSMNVMRRAARVVADEGFAELFRRVGVKLLRPKPPRVPDEPPLPVVVEDPLPARLEKARQDYAQQVAAFQAATRHLQVEGLSDYYWYHVVDLGGGLVTPGDYDFRDQWSSFGFPDDLTGMRVLDVGSATGYFAFEFERHGAEVTSVELPSLANWDVLAHERDRILTDLMASMKVQTPEAAFDRHLDGPFRFCHAALESHVKRCHSTVYDLTLAKLGGEKFDLVYAGDVLLHLFSPLKALDVLAGLCRGELYATVDLPFPGSPDHPLMRFMGWANEQTDRRTWWMLNSRCVCDMLTRLGFRSASVVGTYSGIARRAWFPYTREVIRASRG